MNAFEYVINTLTHLTISLSPFPFFSKWNTLRGCYFVDGKRVAERVILGKRTEKDDFSFNSRVHSEEVHNMCGASRRHSGSAISGFR